MSVNILFIGILVSLFVTELTGLSPGGIIVPGYIALFLLSPMRLAGTFAIALLSYGVYRLLSLRFILFGRRRFSALILIGATFAFLAMTAIPRLKIVTMDLRAIGWVVPGLLANSFDRQRVLPTSVLTLASGTAAFALSRLLFAV